MRIGNSSVPAKYLHGLDIVSVDHVKDLGFHYDCKLSFAGHYKFLYRKAVARTFLIFKGLSTKDRNILLRAYKTYVRPIVEVGSVVYCPHKKADKALLEKVQNNFTRKLLIRNGGFLYSRIPSAKFRNSYYNLPSLESRRKVADVCMVFKMLCGMQRVELSKFYKVNSSITRGGAEKIFYVGPRTTTRLKSFTCRAGSSYLSLKLGLAASPSSFPPFKRKVSKLLLCY